MKALIINDIHIDPKRVGGTTQVTAAMLRGRIQLQLQTLIMGHLDKHLIINGDLLDEFTIDTVELLTTYFTLLEWCEQSDEDARLFICAGNHDRSAKGSKISSFELLCRILESASPKVVAKVEGAFSHLYGDVWVIPHCDNSELFELELDKAIDLIGSGASLLLHCNYDSPWEHKDHSLNISAEKAQQFVDKDIRLIIAHEHQKRVLKKGMVYITGNQFASSIADCLGNDAKYAHILHEDLSIEPIQTSDITKEFIAVDWTQLENVTDQHFVRVEGKATAAQAVDVINTISKFRQHSETLVISNAVKIEGAGGIEDFEGVSLEEIKSFDVLASLLEQLDPAQQTAVKSLLEDK